MEKEFVGWLKSRLHPAPAPVQLGVGDDAGVIDVAGPMVVTTDTIADGTHFDSSVHSLEQIGHKAISVNLSDIAAMGAAPTAATINFLCPYEFGLDDAKALFMGIEKTANRFDTCIFGGDTNCWDGKLVVSATLFGTANSNTEFWKMSGSKPGDVILVSGELGGSILNKHIEFVPRVELASYLAGKFSIHSATDITDSLAIDLAAMAKQSELGFQLNANSIPISEDARTLSEKSGRPALEHAIYDGEDFELLLSTTPETADLICLDDQLPVAVHRIGKFTDAPDFLIVGEDSEIGELEIRGYEH